MTDRAASATMTVAMKALTPAFRACAVAALLAAALPGCTETRVVHDNSVAAKLGRSGASSWIHKDRDRSQFVPQGAWAAGQDPNAWTTSPNFQTTR